MNKHKKYKLSENRITKTQIKKKPLNIGLTFLKALSLLQVAGFQQDTLLFERGVKLSSDSSEAHGSHKVVCYFEDYNQCTC